MSQSAVAEVTGEHLVRPGFDASKRLIVALDVPSVDEARKIVKDLGEVVSFYKIGIHLHWDKRIWKFIDTLINTGKDVFIDYKYSDIGESMRGGVAGAAQHRIKFLTIQGNGEMTEESMRAAVKGKGTDGLPKIFMVTLVTSSDDDDLRKLGHKDKREELVLKRVEMAVRAGLDGVISSGREALAIREATKNVKPKFLIITPGIRPTGVPHDEHKRVCTPTQAIEQEADYLVVGRPIIYADRRIDAAKQIIAEMQAAFDRRLSK